MKFFVKESHDYQETELEIRCQKYDDDIHQLISYIKKYNHTLICKKNGRKYTINIYDIYYIESVDNQSFIYTKDDCYEIKYALYELEDLLKDDQCIRISKTCILNIYYLKSVKALINGKYEATLINDEKLIINRRYVSHFKKVFGL